MSRHDYRAVYYDHDGTPHVIRPKNAAEDTPEHMDFMLSHFVESGYGTGGYVEEHVEGIGWVVSD